MPWASVGYTDTENLHAYQYDDGETTYIGNGIVHGINDSGQVVGYEWPECFLYADGHRTSLELGYDKLFVTGINNIGQIIGYSDGQSGLARGCFLFEDGIRTDFGGNFPKSINNQREIIGGSGSYIFLYKNGVIQNIVEGWLYEMDINDHGRIVGSSEGIAFIWENDVFLSLGSLGGDSYAHAINDNQQIVGMSFLVAADRADINRRAFLYEHGIMKDLNNLVPIGSGWILYEAIDINNSGWIIACGSPDPGRYYVSTNEGDDGNSGLTPTTAFKTIQRGIDVAREGQTVVVLSGVYRGSGNRDIDFKGKSTTVRSEDANEPGVVAATIIDCNGTVADPHRGFHFHSGEDPNSILEGFTITNGYGPNEPFGASEYSAGGAIYCNDSSPTIRKCVIKNNYAGFWGGGFWFSNSRALVTECTFRENVSGDTGGGLHNSVSRITVSNCLFTDNSADAGGGIYNIDGTSTVKNTLFVGNSAAIAGGGLRNKRVASTISNCTFFDNQAPAGGAIHNVLCAGTNITNCILWANPDSEIEGDAEVTYCDVKGGWPGQGNIDADPCFANVNEDDFHLRSQFGRWEPTSKTWVLDTVTSPCIDRGDPSDPAGDEPNPNRNRINQGAYGGTAEASKSPDCTEALLSDLNHDCRVDFLDFAIFVSQWLECRIEPPDFCWW